MQTLGLSGAAAAVGGAADLSSSARAAQAAPDAPVILGPAAAPVTLSVNGAPTTLTIDPATTLLEALRQHMGLTGSKEVCDRGACGGCSVLVDGALVASCMMLALDAQDAEITTIEGVAGDGELHAVQESLVRHDGLQCGFCTPGFVMACKALLDADPKPDLPAIKRGLSGNICRCGTYTNIFNAVLEASGQSVPVDCDAARAGEG